MDCVHIERGQGPEGRVAVVTFDRADGINALSVEAMRQLRRAAECFEDDTTTSVVVLTGGRGAFSAGFDLKDPEGRRRGDMGLGERRAALSAGPRMCRAWREMEQVTIAAIEGHCVGGGVALVASLDFRIAAHGSHFRIPEVALGMNMSWGSLPRLVQLMGPARAKQAVILASDRIDSSTAEKWGLVEETVDDGTALQRARALADRIAAQPPIPVMMTKATINRISGALDDLSTHMDRDQFALTNTSEDFREGIAAFLDRRVPRFRGK